MNLQEENKKLLDWINDLQSGMYINCVYCGHRYGPTDTTPDTKAEMLKKHIEQCPEHPMSKLKEENNKLKEILKELINLDITTLEFPVDDYGNFVYEKSDQKKFDDLQNKAKQLLEKS